VEVWRRQEEAAKGGRVNEIGGVKDLTRTRAGKNEMIKMRRLGGAKNGRKKPGKEGE
jgi:hypothetical protein